MIHTSLRSTRTRRITDEVIGRLSLDLRGIRVLTEAATDAYAVTPALAARAGAEVWAVAEDTAYGTAGTARETTMAVAKKLDVEDRVHVSDSFPERAAGRAELIANLGAIRPLDERRVDQLAEGAVIALMYDRREYRPGEIDLKASRERGIAVAGVNEEHPDAGVLEYAGLPAVGLLLEAGIEIARNHVVLAGHHFLTEAVRRRLSELGARTRIVTTWSELDENSSPGPGEHREHSLERIDAVVHMDYDENLGSPPSRDRLLAHEGAVLVQYFGGAPIDAFRSAGWAVVPEEPIAARTMARTFGWAGLRPVANLHAAGLKAARLALDRDLSEGDPERDSDSLLQLIR